MQEQAQAPRAMWMPVAAAYVAPRPPTLLPAGDVAPLRPVPAIVAGPAHPICCDGHESDAAARRVWDAVCRTVRCVAVAQPVAGAVVAWADDARAWPSKLAVRCFPAHTHTHIETHYILA